jgi:eukaryotic-like serine/threonine-protein kinase
MPEAWSHWEGHAVNGKYQLNKCLGSSEQSAVFLTNHPEHGATTIKLITGDPANAELQLARWGEAQKLSHPNLVRIYDFGRCQLDTRDLIFAVMEHADESLAQILSERALNAQEAREMLTPILDALACLHVQGFVLGSLKPGNVLATNDQLKLSSDGIGRIGETASHVEQPGAYDAPEMAGGRRSPAADVWSLGMTLAEVLTQRLPAWSVEGEADPVLRDMPAPFHEIVRGCLRRDAKSRFTVADVADRLYKQVPKLQPRTAVAKPAPQKPVTTARARQEPARSEADSIPGLKPWLWRTAFPVGLTVVGVAVLFAGFGFLRHPPASQPEASLLPPEQNAQTDQKPQSDQASSSEKKPFTSAKPDARHASRKTESGREAVSANLNAPAAVQPQQASLRSTAQPSASSLTPASDQPAGGPGPGVVQRAVPDVPKSASDTIQGTIRVSVKVKVDPSGNVAGSEMVVPGSSKYFARLSLDSAPKWKFAPSQDSGREFLLHFEFKNSGTRAYATR